MGRKRKTRTHLKADAAHDVADASVPKSFIVKHGQVGASVSQLVRDIRKVMEPNTASRLKERNRNKLKDYLTLAPVLHVSHLLAFTLTDVAPSMRVIRLSNGPTLSFRVERYSLIKDILNTSKHARSIGMEYLTPPLLVLASFPPPGPTTPPHLPLVMKAFQSLFPSLSPQTLTLSSARRVVLVARGHIQSSSGSVLDLGNEKDVADFLLRQRGQPGPDGGYESAASSAESVAGDEKDAVNLADDYVGRNNKKGQSRAVRLDEVGPRLELRLVKITEGVPGKEGSVIYHEFVKKSKKDIAAQKATHAAKEKLRKERREEQERNVARKKSEKANKAGKSDDVEEVEEEEEADWTRMKMMRNGMRMRK
ncbi:hypothetical protein D9757_001739 [Collybiopsis confluens]|uniref:Brix domain-containing protein n=1 Tax=Collybiopsis confluens TaxID=2823264 RepID=A0A8H5HYJ3_9AGAR|nr:hypothetical protein D9757_001739 [Collybiopsis confluens]